LRVGVLGGTFDPPHLGHLVLASCAAEQLGLERVLFVPAGDPWRKAARRVTPAAQRLEMTRLAIAGDPRFDVDPTEVQRQGPSYTSDTLRELKQRLAPESHLYFLVGEDALEDIRYWHEPEAIFAAATLAVAPRMETPVPEPPSEHAGSALALPPFERIDMPYIGISSTDLRRRVQRGESLRYLVPDAVGRYIREQGLYQA
jgi:nicotinate-nucleotide adenylyltransferase